MLNAEKDLLGKDTIVCSFDRYYSTLTSKILGEVLTLEIRYRKVWKGYPAHPVLSQAAWKIKLKIRIQHSVLNTACASGPDNLCWNFSKP